MDAGTSPPTDEIIVRGSDIRRAAAEGVITGDEAEALLRWMRASDGARPATPAAGVERARGLHWVSVAYYGGALLMISACAWFLGDKWTVLGSGGILVTTALYFVAAMLLGLWLRRMGYMVAGGLLITVAVSLVPLITYSIEDLLGLWPVEDPGTYKDFYPLILAEGGSRWSWRRWRSRR